MLLNMRQLYAASKFTNPQHELCLECRGVVTDGISIIGSDRSIYYRYQDEFLNDPEECFKVIIPNQLIAMSAVDLRGELDVNAEILKTPTGYSFQIEGQDEVKDFKSITDMIDCANYLYAPKLLDSGKLPPFKLDNILLNLTYMAKLFEVAKLITSSDGVCDTTYIHPILRFTGEQNVVYIDFNYDGVDCILMPIDLKKVKGK